jgi:two-component system sensor histidine kinase UhpB
MSTPTITSHRHWWRDLALILVLTLTYFWLATRGDWSERISRFFELNEAWQLDELPLTLLLLSLGLCWFSWRRTQEFRQELARRIYAETQVQGLAAHNKDLSQQLLRTQEAERQSLARELHDEFGQHCTAIRAEARFIHNAVSQIAQAADLQRIALSARHINDSAEDLYSMVRDMLTRLRPPTLDSLGLEFSLQELCEEWEKKTDIAVVFYTRNLPTKISDEIGIAYYRIVQEALTNVARHAHATRVQVNLSNSADGRLLQLRVADNGGGGGAQPLTNSSGYGLRGMRERIEGLQGHLVFGPSNTTSGWCIEASVQLDAAISKESL